MIFLSYSSWRLEKDVLDLYRKVQLKVGKWILFNLDLPSLTSITLGGSAFFGDPEADRSFRNGNTILYKNSFKFRS